MIDRFKNKPLIIIAGPTAVGKTDISVKLANKINGSIISADSMQVYKYMDIGSAKIMPDEMCGIPHYLVDVLEPSDDFGVNIFQSMAYEALEDIYSKGRIPIIVGGTGFYIQALLYGIEFNDEEDHDYTYRNELNAIACSEEGKIKLHKMLDEVDPEYASSVHYNNAKRVIRALEYNKFTGRKFSEYNSEQRAKKSPFNFVYFALNNDRDVLYKRIDMRVDKMIEQGLVEEVTKLYEMGYNRSNTSMQGLGYKELIDYLDGLQSLEEAIEIIKRDTRHFAKRQLTWLKREDSVIFMDKSQNSDDEILNQMINIIKEQKIWNSCTSN